MLLRSSPADGVALVVLDRVDRRNALSIALRDAMSDALDELAGDQSVRCVVIAGSGSTFCAGFDLGEFEVALGDEAFAAGLWASSDRWHHRLLSFPLPLVAAIHGAALGGGFDLAMMCDVRLAAADAVFAHPEHAFSEVVYGPLAAATGATVANDLALTGRRIDAAEALALGVVSRVVDGDVLAAATAAASDVAAAPRPVLERMKAKVAGRAGLLGTDGSGAPTLSL